MTQKTKKRRKHIVKRLPKRPKLEKRYSPLDLNVDKLARMYTFGVVNSVIRYTDFEVTPEGKALTVPYLGGIVMDYDLGDPTDKYVSDHLQPGVTITATGTCDPGDEENKALMALVCVGNTVIVTDRYSSVKGSIGRVIGKHGGVNYIMVRFDKKVMELIEDDSVKVELYGQGLASSNYPDLQFRNIDPVVLVSIPLKHTKEYVSFPVAGVYPADVMGSGLGSDEMFSDYDMQSSHPAVKDVRIGDLVAIENYYAYTGFSYKKGATTLGVIVHGSCVTAGHGPGVLPIVTCATSMLRYHIDKTSNLKKYL